MLKRIGTRARQRIEELWGHQVHLKLWVRVTPRWRESRRTARTSSATAEIAAKGSQGVSRER
jgi:GTPase Era involved in 16S rRNA processing